MFLLRLYEEVFVVALLKIIDTVSCLAETNRYPFEMPDDKAELFFFQCKGSSFGSLVFPSSFCN